MCCVSYHLKIESLIFTERLDILCVTETWLNSCIPNEIKSISGFLVHRKDRKQTTLPRADLGGGSVAIFIREDINCSLQPTFSPLDCEMLTIKISHYTQSFFFSVIPPRQPITSLTVALDQFSDLFDDHDCILDGVYNAKHAHWK